MKIACEINEGKAYAYNEDHALETMSTKMIRN